MVKYKSEIKSAIGIQIKCYLRQMGEARIIPGFSTTESTKTGPGGRDARIGILSCTDPLPVHGPVELPPTSSPDVVADLRLWPQF